MRCSKKQKKKEEALIRKFYSNQSTNQNDEKFKNTNLDTVESDVEENKNN